MANDFWAVLVSAFLGAKVTCKANYRQISDGVERVESITQASLSADFAADLVKLEAESRQV
eukprot:5494559-Pyramimonas_sp.AAC.1